MASKLRRETLSEQLAEHLIRFVADQRLEPGDFLPSATTIAEEFSVSRPVVREALRTLEARGLVRTENGRGAIVQPVNSDLLSHYFHRATSADKRALVELLEVRKGLEVESARLAAVRSTDSEIAEIGEVVRKMGTALGKGAVYAELDAKLHLRIAAATHNTTLYHLIESIRGPLKDSIEAGLRSRANAIHLLRVQTLHEDLLQALIRRDPEAAASVMTLHFDEAVQHIAGTVAPDAGSGTRR